MRTYNEEKAFTLNAIADNLDLLVAQSMKRNQHYAEKHLLSIKEMKARFTNESVKASSTFEDLESARLITYQTLMNNLIQLENWLNVAYSKERVCFYSVFQDLVGYGMFVNDELVYGTNCCKVVLEKVSDAREFEIVSAMPYMNKKHAIEI